MYSRRQRTTGRTKTFFRQCKLQRKIIKICYIHPQIYTQLQILCCRGRTPSVQSGYILRYILTPSPLRAPSMRRLSRRPRVSSKTKVLGLFSGVIILLTFPAWATAPSASASASTNAYAHTYINNSGCVSSDRCSAPFDLRKTAKTANHRQSQPRLPAYQRPNATRTNEISEARQPLPHLPVPLPTMAAASNLGNARSLLDVSSHLDTTNNGTGPVRSMTQSYEAPRTRASTAQKRLGGGHSLKAPEPVPHGTNRRKPRTRASAVEKRPRRSPPRKPIRRGLGVAIDGEYEVQRIVEHRATPYGDEYKVVWADTWVTAKDLKGAQQALQDFKSTRFGKISKAPLSKRVRGKPRVSSRSFCLSIIYF